MKSNELRVGNILTVGNYDVKVIEIHHLGVQVCDLEETQDTWEPYVDRIKPIPLTEEWLFKFGFEIGYNQKKMLDVYCKDFDFLIERSNSDNFYYKKVFIQYVHQLQNLYFALTGEELTLKPE